MICFDLTFSTLVRTKLDITILNFYRENNFKMYVPNGEFKSITHKK